MTSNSYKGPQPRRYSNQDLYPTRWDPRCSSQFPLGNFWPVYLGNFWCEVYSQHATKVQEYFASKGLLVRMVFGRSEKNDPHFHFQKKANLYDFLVYFVRLEDAQDAVSYCHREKYYGHRLNVFPGRTPINLDPSTSVKHTAVQFERLALTEQVVEQYLLDVASAQVACVVKHSEQDFLVQYASVNDRNNAIRTCKIFFHGKIFPGQPRQRFMEQDVEQELLQRIRTDRSFMDMQPPNDILEALLNGFLPASDYQWRTVDKFKMPNQQQLRGRKKFRRKLTQRMCQQGLNLFGVQCDFYYEPTPEVQENRRKRKLKRKLQKKKNRALARSRVLVPRIDDESDSDDDDTGLNGRAIDDMDSNGNDRNNPGNNHANMPAKDGNY